MATAATSSPSVSQLPAPDPHSKNPQPHSQTLPHHFSPAPTGSLVSQLPTALTETQAQAQTQTPIVEQQSSGKPPPLPESINSLIPSPNAVKSIRTNYKHRQSSLSTSSAKGNRPSIFNFAALAREKTSSALAGLSEPTLRSEPSSGSLYLSAQSSPSSTSPSRTSPRSPSSRETLRSVSPNTRTPTTTPASLASTQTANSSNPSLSETNPPSQAYSSIPDSNPLLLPSVPKPGHNKMHQTSSRLLRMTSDDRPFTRDFKDLFSTLVVSLPLAPHRVRLTRVDHSFVSEEAINNLGSLKFSQSNRMPDPKDPSRIVTTTTTTTFSMAREMARSVCQRFLDARFVESADGKQAKEFTMKSSVWQLTPKGIHVLERFCARNGIQQKHVAELINSPRNTMRLVILERDLATDKLSSDRSTIEVIFRRFVGTNGPNVKSSTSSADSDSLSEYKDGIAGVRMAHERKIGSPPKVVYQTFTGKAATDWLMDCCTTVDRRETTEMATLFLEQDLIWCVQSDRAYLQQTGQEKDGHLKFQPTKNAIYQLSQKGKDVLSMNNRERTSESEGTTQTVRPGVSRDSNTQKLDKILNDAALRLLFRENLRDTHCEENLSFYLDVDEFLTSCRAAIDANLPNLPGRSNPKRSTSGQGLDSVKETMASAYGIYNAFLAPGSPCELNIDHLLRNQLATRMTKAVGQDAAMIDSLKEVTKLFEEAQISVFKLMASDSVPKFMKSSKYEQTLKNYDFDSLAGKFKDSMHLPERSMSRSGR